MVRLRIHNNHPAELVHIYLSKWNHADAQQPNHRQVVRTINGIDVRNRHIQHFAPQQPTDGHRAGDRIRIGVDDDQNVIVA